MVYLKPNIVIEPLVDRWYAWPHLITPATAAMNIAGRHLKIMNSYIQAPHLHKAAVANPAMRGGPFIDMNGNRVEELKQLRDATANNHRVLLDFAAAIKELDEMLRQEAKGFSLEALYEKVPEPLRGYVELVYDLNNQPSFRLFESLLYQSPVYKEEMQSIALWETKNDERPFVLSTPRLNEPDVLHLPIPFDHQGIDVLARMKREGGNLEEIAAILGIPAEQRGLFDSFFTRETPPPYQRYQGNKIRMRYFGHACILVETDEISILIDPLISYYGYHSGLDHFSDVDLPDVIDYVLITHNHQDHILFETLLPLRHKIRNLVVPSTRSGALQDPNLKLMFRQIGFSNVIEMDEMETFSFGDCIITGLPFTGEHGDLNARAKLCYHVNLSSFTLLFVADSRVVEPRLYEHVQKALGDVDVIFLGMECDGAPMSWLYGPLLTGEMPRDKDSSRRLAGSDYGKGISLVDVFHPSEVYVYAMGQEPWVEFISSIKYSDQSNPIIQSNELVAECLRRNMLAERLYGEKEILYHRPHAPAFHAVAEEEQV